MKRKRKKLILKYNPLRFLWSIQNFNVHYCDGYCKIEPDWMLVGFFPLLFFKDPFLMKPFACMTWFGVLTIFFFSFFFFFSKWNNKPFNLFNDFVFISQFIVFEVYINRLMVCISSKWLQDRGDIHTLNIVDLCSPTDRFGSVVFFFLLFHWNT